MKLCISLAASFIVPSSNCLKAQEAVILFEKGYINWAWGFTHSGFYVDNHGRIFNYSHEKEDSVYAYGFDGLYDGGSIYCKAFMPDSSSIKFKEVLLYQAGGWTITNTSGSTIPGFFCR